MKYTTYERNHVIIPGREEALTAFLKTTYKGMNHKWNNGFSSNSEDALTWSCFEMFTYKMPLCKKLLALDEIFQDSYSDETCNDHFQSKNYKETEIEISVGKAYRGDSIKEETEVDASIELPDKVIFFEAKLYSSISLVDVSKNVIHDQIARKLRVGLDYADAVQKEFYFIFLDIAPPHELLRWTENKSKARASDSSKAKWKSAWWFSYYKHGRNNSLRPLKDVLVGVKYDSLESVAKRMGWLTWADLFKIIMRGIV